MADRENVIKALEDFNKKRICLPHLIPWDEITDAISLLKEQEEQKRKWLRNIADNQLANAPKDRKEFMSLDEHMEYQYQLGVYDGLQMAWDILTEDDNVH